MDKILDYGYIWANGRVMPRAQMDAYNSLTDRINAARAVGVSDYHIEHLLNGRHNIANSFLRSDFHQPGH